MCFHGEIRKIFIWIYLFSGVELCFINHVLTGSASTGGGAGGRIFVSFTETEYTGSFVAYGGPSTYSYGGAGTIYTVENNAKKTIIVDNGEPYTVTVSL